MLMSPSAEMLPTRNSIEEMCPSPVARRLMMKRRHPSGDPALIGVRDDGGIEQGCGFQGVFTGEQRADEQLPRPRERALGEDVVLHFRVVFQQQRFDVEVPGTEFLNARPAVPARPPVGQGKGPADDGCDALARRGNERADDDPRAFREQL